MGYFNERSNKGLSNWTEEELDGIRKLDEERAKNRKTAWYKWLMEVVTEYDINDLPFGRKRDLKTALSETGFSSLEEFISSEIKKDDKKEMNSKKIFVSEDRDIKEVQAILDKDGITVTDLGIASDTRVGAGDIFLSCTGRMFLLQGNHSPKLLSKKFYQAIKQLGGPLPTNKKIKVIDDDF